MARSQTDKWTPYVLPRDVEVSADAALYLESEFESMIEELHDSSISDLVKNPVLHVSLVDKTTVTNPQGELILTRQNHVLLGLIDRNKIPKKHIKNVKKIPIIFQINRINNAKDQKFKVDAKNNQLLVYAS